MCVFTYALNFFNGKILHVSVLTSETQDLDVAWHVHNGGTRDKSIMYIVKCTPRIIVTMYTRIEINYILRKFKSRQDITF